MDSPYPIERAEKIQTRYGETVIILDADIEDINSEKVSLHLVYKGICDKTILHILTIEKQMTLYFIYIYECIIFKLGDQLGLIAMLQ
jgi:hypothetical protein